ncbi:hypothetical protein IGB42_00122 [Andreprevotia sp. IGB-42]|uniref:phosphonopyruvate decarboxylase n=1 Tax=Andreprevotia sp. IGB-42 TaxID=2497473 RepID=UPI00135A3FFF|nr:phosphonopyruvate decarboxylase [Andreprevotia sp. IGB-42]KAF0815045.1 hypothetical protein IGB42_00122 [Andreprevotia sp. IGB-42]
MLEAKTFVDAARARGVGLWTGVPCSYLQPFINHVIGDDSLIYVPASNEGDAVSIAAGYELGGGLAVAMMQNSGLGNAVNPLTSLAHTHQIPLLLIVTLRGEPGGPADEPQHALMGAITTQMLSLMDIPWAYFPGNADEVEPCLDQAMAWIENERRPYCLVMRKGAVAPCAAPEPAPVRIPLPPAEADRLPAQLHATRQQMLQAVQQQLKPRDVVLATTGYTGRELYALDDRAQQLYLVGAMGCASSVGLGLALARPDLRVIVLDGDGAMLMRLGALAAIGYMAPRNLLHVLLDNGLHESTGGQGTVSHSVQLGNVALACGYAGKLVITQPGELVTLLQGTPAGPFLVRALIGAGVPDGLPRPAVTPDFVTRRLRQYIADISQEQTA